MCGTVESWAVPPGLFALSPGGNVGAPPAIVEDKVAERRLYFPRSSGPGDKEEKHARNPGGPPKHEQITRLI